MTKKVILVRYGEIALKSDPVRRQHEKRLKENIKAGFRDANIKDTLIDRKRGRFFIHIPVKKFNTAFKVLKNTFGIVSFSPSWHLKTAEVKEIQKFVKKNYTKWIPRGKTFAVRARRSGSQSEKYTSMQLAKLVGDVVNRKVNLSKPDVTIFAEVRDNESYVYTEVIRGLGGMPVGTAGKVVCLLSGGIDSPVAAWLMMKRGCVIHYIHFHTFRRNKVAVESKVGELIKMLSKHSTSAKAQFVPAGSFQLLASGAPSKYDLIVFRRFMLRMAERLAKDIGAKAIVTGDNLAQVASQTLDNLYAMESSTSLPIFRPLLAYDKQEIIDLGKKIGTYKLSIKPYKDCCSIVARNPSTKADPEIIEGIEKDIDIKKIIKMSLEMSEVVDFKKAEKDKTKNKRKSKKKA
jgi:thiamine biosynthesis protein ThiI